ncbi:hypothetical protein Mia14_0800 [Candidatus Mancarchaeum acidiphilum]|uniref:Rhodanese domain-containing protein n=1 Tax=Candidatus Mancarchaeum acidiphilum TaxID=1920749 RepID=A0A218NNR7_9ARCH|nr:hypothetical protein [Candidatus Mancarchaeum acidiphilum]ASI14093.1 hypothetical protein Mia14_0800 [Candidatus Mancarchaeum acidiphilum]
MDISIKKFSKDNSFELDFDNGLEIVKRGDKKLVWLGTEPISRIRKILGIEKNNAISLKPEEAIYFTEEQAKKMEGCVLLCYNGTTSAFLNNYFKKKFGVNTYLLDGGLKGHEDNYKLFDDSHLLKK